MDCHKIGKLADACDTLQKPRLNSRDVEILEEYMKIIEPVAVSIGHSSGGGKMLLRYYLSYNQIRLKEK